MNRTLRTFRSRHQFARRPACEPLEGRALLSGLNIPASLESGLIGGINQHTIKTVPQGVSAIVGALTGGPGSEFVNLLRHQIKNPAALLDQFTSGVTTQATTPGAAARVATILDTFTGGHEDDLAVVAAGVLVLPKHTLELGAILRGPNDTTGPSYYVFGIDRGAGATLGPVFPERPGITPDALVTITVQPNNSDPTGTITDLTSGAVTTVAPSQIQVKGSTLRVFLQSSQLPSEGLPVNRYRYAFWTESQPGGGFGSVGSIVPDSTLNPIGVQAGGRK